MTVIFTFAVLEEVRNDVVYILGGIVDLTIIKVQS
jgi:Trm5-related predicted tRNA methylase